LLLPLAIPGAIHALGDQSATTANGGTDPYPIPWLDKNGSHNQPAGLNLEPSHIYHFKGRVARCSTFTGMGTDNKGNRIAFGSASNNTTGGFHTHLTYAISGTGCPCQSDS
jgi:hypothetical protein